MNMRLDKPRVRAAVLTQSDGSQLRLDTVERIPDPTAWTLEDITGWYTGSGVRRDTSPRYGHGMFMGPGFRDGRYMTLRGSVRCANTIERDWQERSLGGLLGDGKKGTLWADTGDAQLITEVGLDGSPQVEKVGTHALVFQVPLVSESSFLYGEWRESTIRPAYAGVGFDFPPLSEDRGHGPIITFGEGVASDDLIWNDGNADAWARFEVHGNFPGGVAVSVDDRRLSYPWPIYPGTPVLFDEEGSLRIGGRDQSHLLAERAWTPTAPRSISRVALHPLRGGTGWATAWHRDTYI